jgi:predicted DNA-binding ribbon-helix-helix protein
LGAARGHDPAGRLRPADKRSSRIIKRSVVVAGHRTSVSLEDAFWEALVGIAARQGASINALIGAIDRGRAGNLSSAIRVYVLNQIKG